MIINQRWLKRRDYEAPAAIFDPSIHCVELIHERTAKPFVITHHYSGTYPAARCAVGLYRMRGPVWSAELVGVAVYSVPSNERVIPCYAPKLTPLQGVELGRFVLMDFVEANAETWFLARANKLAAAQLGVMMIVSYSDPMERTRADGSVYKPGHTGGIYRAGNARYLGTGSPRTLYLDREGGILAPRALSKIIGGERGHEYAEEQVRIATGLARREGESGESYVHRARAALRRVRHPGNHVFAWGMTRGVELAPAVPFVRNDRVMAGS